MADRKYAVTFGGELIEGMTPARLRERLAKLPEPLSSAQIDALLAAHNATLKLFADRESANHFLSDLREAGMVCWLRLLHPGETVQALLEMPAPAPAEPMVQAVETTPATRAAPIRKPMLGPGALTALIIVGITGSIAAAYLWPRSSRHHRPVAATSADSTPAATSEQVAIAQGTPAQAEVQAPEAQPQKNATKSLMVPEPTLTVAAPKPKSDAPATAEAAKLEAPKTDEAAAQTVKTSLQPGSGVATFAPAPAATSPALTPAVAKPSAAPSTQVAMNGPAVAVPKSNAIVPPTYDRARVAQPKYPAQSFRNGEQGEVLLNVLVGTDGKPKRVTIDRTSGFTLLDRAAIEAVRSWQFTPGTRNGAPQEAARQVAVGFKLGEQ